MGIYRYPLLNPLNWNFEIEEIDRIFRSTYFGPNLSPWGSPKAIIKNKLVRQKERLFKFTKI